MLKMFSLHSISLAVCVTTIVAGNTAAQNRPAITGISHMCLYASDAKASEHFYAQILGAAKSPDPQDANGTRYYFSPTQFVELLPLPSGATRSRMGCVAYNTQDAASLLQYVRSKGVGGSSE